MPAQRFRLEGAKELDAALAALGVEVAAKAGNAALRKGARVIRDELIERAPFDPTRRPPAAGQKDYGHLRDNIRVRRQRADKPYMLRLAVTTGRAFWGALLEWGTVKLSPRPWARPAFEASKQAALTAIMSTLKVAIDRAAKRAARRPRRPRRMGHNGGPPLDE